MLSIISFTEKGAHLSLKLLDMLSEEGENAWLYTKCSKYREIKDSDMSIPIQMNGQRCRCPQKMGCFS